MAVVLWASVSLPLAQAAEEKVVIELADGFDFPVGKPDGDGYYRFRGFYPNGHLGEDWNGRGGGNTDLGDPIYSIGSGIVVLSEDMKSGWGNVVIVRHAYRDKDGAVRVVDSLYGHLNERKVKLYEKVGRGQVVGTMGNNRGMYYAHLHFEVRKNLNIGMNRSKFKQDYSNYHSPSTFIKAHRKLAVSSRKYAVPINTFEAYDKQAATRRPLFGGGKDIQIPLLERKEDGGEEGEEDSALAGALSGLESYDDVIKDPDFWKKLKERLKK